MFKLAANPTFIHTVPIQVPVDTGYEEQTLRIRYAIQHDDKIAHLNMSDPAQTLEFLRLVVIGFEDVVDADDKPVPYTAEYRDELLGYPYIRLGLIGGYYKGMFKATSGN